MKLKQNATGASMIARHERRCTRNTVGFPREMNVMVHDVCEGGKWSSHSKRLSCYSVWSDVVPGY